jgi:hypothetical protein
VFFRVVLDYWLAFFVSGVGATLGLPAAFGFWAAARGRFRRVFLFRQFRFDAEIDPFFSGLRFFEQVFRLQIRRIDFQSFFQRADGFFILRQLD